MEPLCSAFSFDGGRVEPLINFFVPLNAIVICLVTAQKHVYAYFMKTPYCVAEINSKC